MFASAQSRSWLSWVWALLVLGGPAGAADPRFDTERRLDVEVHEIAFWIADPSHGAINAQTHYANPLPGIAASQRKREGAAADRHAPLGMILFRGQPEAALDVDLRVTLGRFLGHWPPAEVKTGRLRWLDAELVAPGGQAPLPFVAGEHWFQTVRKWGGLQLKHKARQDALLAYDVELTIPGQFPIQLEATDGNYRLINLGKHPLLDAFIGVPGESGMRFVWLDQIDAAPAANRPAETQPANGQSTAETTESASTDRPQPVAAAVPIGGAVAGAAQVVAAVKLMPARPIEASATPAAAATSGDTPPANAASPQGKTVDLALPLAMTRSDPAYAEQTKGQFLSRLAKSGLTATEGQWLADRYSEDIFAADQVVVLYRLHPADLEDRLPLAIEPEPRQLVRSAWVLVRNLDPRIRTNLKDLISQLGSRAFADREHAEEQLQNLGRLAIESLKEAQKNSDPEVVFRAKRLLQAAGEQVSDD